jgi:hypothetical protein
MNAALRILFGGLLGTLALLGSVQAQAPITSAAIRITSQRPGPAPNSTLVTLQSGAVIEVASSDLQGESLAVSIIEPTCIPAVRVVLVSSRAVIVPLRDLVDGAKVGQRPAASCQPPWTAAPTVASSSGVPANSDAMATIRAECAKRHPTNFALRNACEELQLKALEQLRSR